MIFFKNKPEATKPQAHGSATVFDAHRLHDADYNPAPLQDFTPSPYVRHEEPAAYNHRAAAIPTDKVFNQGYMSAEEAIVQDNTSKSFEKKIECHYQPLWDLHKNALTTYVCTPVQAMPKSADNDIALIETAITELGNMCANGQRLIIACPVRHETLYRHDSFEKILSLCGRMPEELRKLLIFIVVDFRDDLPRTSCFWFLPALKNYARGVFARLYLTEKWDFNVLRNAGFDAVGVSIEEAGDGEQGMMKRLTSFSDGAKAALVSRTFAIGVATRSLATYCVCMGFGYLGGAAVHDMVAAPDSIYRYRNEDLFAALIVNNLAGRSSSGS